MIEVEREGRLRVLRLARVAKANALTTAMLEALVAAVDTAVADGVAVLVLTGAGPVFSAGADLAEMQAGLALSPLWERLSASVAAFPGLTIAALNGTVAGGALGMTLACDIRLAVPGGQVFYPVMRLGYLPQPSDPARLTALVGPGRARMILLAGARIGVDEALIWGLVDRIVPAERLMDAVREVAADALAAEPLHLAALKRMVG